MAEKVFDKSGNWALILGGSSGMGLAAAKKLAASGMHICIVHRDRKSELARIHKEFDEIRATGVKCLFFNSNALRSEDQKEVMEALKKELQSGEKVKLLMHSIARGNLKPLTTQLPEVDWAKEFKKGGLTPVSDAEIKERFPKKQAGMSESEMSTEDYTLTIQAMAVSYFEWMQLLFNNGLCAENALGIALTSEGNQRVWRYYGAVAAAKTSLEAISRSIALEYGGLGLRSNIIQAGVTNTPSLQMIPGSDILKKNAILKNPLHRLTTPEDVANAVYLLCLPEANWINGAIIPVDGGESLS